MTEKKPQVRSFKESFPRHLQFALAIWWSNHQGEFVIRWQTYVVGSAFRYDLSNIVYVVFKKPHLQAYDAPPEMTRMLSLWALSLVDQNFHKFQVFSRHVSGGYIHVRHKGWSRFGVHSDLKKRWGAVKYKRTVVRYVALNKLVLSKALP